MRDLLSALASVLIFLLVRPGLAQNQDTTAALVLACDRAAASPSDTNRPVGVAGVPSGRLDSQIAVAACEAAAAAAPDNPRITFQLGRAHAAAKADESARAHFSKASDLGYAAAQASLGDFLASGRGGLARNNDEALRLFKLAAEQGDPFGTNNLGFFYETGRGGLAKDDRVAARLYQLAADDGESWGQYNLGRFHQYGRGGLPQNDEEAARLYRLAAEQGLVAGQFTLGVWYEEGRGGLPRDDAEAARLYRLSAEQGGPYAQYRLAMFYEEGLGGLQKNIGEATRLYKLAAEQDSYLAPKRQASDALKRLGAATAPSAPSSRTQAVMPVIGILDSGFPNRDADYFVAFRQGLAKAGYIEGRNTAIEYRWASSQNGRLPALAMDLVQRGVTLIVAVGNGRVAHVANAATSKIPIVAAYAGDMVKDDLVASLNQPGRNITGVTDGNTQLGGKRLSLLRELVPEATTFGFLAGGRADWPHPALWDSYEEQTSNILAAAREIGREVIILEAPSDRDYEAALATLVQRHARALVVGAFSFGNWDKLLGLAARYKIPTIYPGRGYVVAGGLLGYFPDTDEVFRQIGIYAGRILKGAKPSDLPVAQPTKYDLIVNLKTAKALGLTIPETLLAPADEVIQ